MHEDPPLYPPPPPSTAAAFKTKSKGKGRAQPDEEQGLSFGIRFTDGQTPDLVDLWVGHRETVRDLKRRVRATFTGQEALPFEIEPHLERPARRSGSSAPRLWSSSKSTPSPGPKPTVDRVDSD